MTSTTVKKKKKNKKKKEKGSQKEYPEFEMPSKSLKRLKLKEVEDQKQKKIKEGFFQVNSNQDDTLEKVESLSLEHSERTKKVLKTRKDGN